MSNNRYPVVFWAGTQAEYNALSSKSNNTIYFITDTNALYRGSQSFGGGDSAPEVVSSGGSVAYIPVLSGGKVYRYSEPLVTLSVGSIADTPVEDTILFSAGGVVSPPASMTVWFQSRSYDDEEGTLVGSKAISLISSGGSYVYNPDGNDNWSEASNEDSAAWSLLSGGSFVGISSGGTITISAHNVGVYWASGYNDEMEGEFYGDSGSSSLNGLVASSTNGGSSWTFVGLRISAYYWDYGIESDTGSACKAEFSPIITPCAVMLPSGAELVGSSKFALESGHHYEMNIANGGIVVAERFAQEVQS